MARPAGRNRRSHLLLSAERHGLAQGLFKARRAWLYVGTTLFTIRTVRRFVGRKTEVLLSEEIRPGDRLIISNNRPTLDGVEVAMARGRRGRKGR